MTLLYIYLYDFYAKVNFQIRKIQFKNIKKKTLKHKQIKTISRRKTLSFYSVEKII